jgi:hypothetical protein
LNSREGSGGRLAQQIAILLKMRFLARQTLSASIPLFLTNNTDL